MEKTMINMKDLIKNQTNIIRKNSGMKLVTEKKELDQNDEGLLSNLIFEPLDT